MRKVWNVSGRVFLSVGLALCVVCLSCALSGETAAAATVTQVVAGYAHTVALENNRSVWTWGDNTYGQLGIGSTAANSSLWAQNRKAAMTSSASLPIGKYKLDMPIDGLSGLTEFSQVEYTIYGRNFEGEKNYNAPGVEFVKRPWKVALGTVSGKVYKIAFYFESDSKNTVTDVSTDVVQFCQQRLGEPSEQQETVLIWDTPDGNVVLQFGKVGTTYMINLFETSRSVRTFSPKR